MPAGVPTVKLFAKLVLGNENAKPKAMLSRAKVLHTTTRSPWRDEELRFPYVNGGPRGERQ